MKTFARAPDSTTERVNAIIAKFHPDLHAVSVRVDCVSTVNTDPDEPALLLHGYPCAAVVRVLGSKDRAMGRGDAEIVFDEAGYIAMSDQEKDALIDHELTHLVVKKKPSGRAMLDEHNRPKLEMRLHDRQFGWFDQIAQRHGSASLECKQALGLVLKAKQVYFNFDMNGKLGEGVRATVSLLS